MITENTTLSNGTVSNYDHKGAALYITVILTWYSTGLAMMLFLQVRPRALHHQSSHDSSNLSKRKNFPSLKKNSLTNYRNIQADDTQKQILNELKDPERRKRLWKIYYASPEEHDESYSQYYQTITSDTATIDRINRKLADIHGEDLKNEKPNLFLNVTTTSDNRLLTGITDSTKPFSRRFPILRRSAANTTPNSRPPLVRGHSESEAPIGETTVQMKPVVSFKNSGESLQESNTIYPNRFKIEKVSNTNDTTT